MLPELAKRNSFDVVALMDETEGDTALDEILGAELDDDELTEALIEEETLLDCGALVG